MKPVLFISFLLLFHSALTAQTCTGSVGDPIVNNTFGSGSTIGPPLPVGTTINLNYSGADCPTDGFYTIINKTNSCFVAGWHSLTDHTGDPNGYFMLINASYDPSTFYLQTIDGLCTGTTYQFAVWIANMVAYTNSILPNITLSIEETNGNILRSISTGNIPVNLSGAEWKQYNFNFTMPVGVSTVVLRMSNSAPGGTGNDLALDDITFRPIGPSIAVSSPDFTNADTVSVCLKDAKKITFHSDVEKCYTVTTYQWQMSRDAGNSWTDIGGANSADYTCQETAAGTYQYRVTVAQQDNIGNPVCRVVSSQRFTVVVIEDNLRTISISKPPGAVCEDNPVTFTAATTYAGQTPSFQWMLNDNAISNANDSVYTADNLSSGDKISCYFVSSFVCNDPLMSAGITVDVLKKARSSIDRFICDGESYEGHTTSGTFDDAFAGSNGCDSIRTLNLVVYPKESSVFDTTICYGTSYLGLSKEGSYNYTYQSVHGCDSVHTVVLHVLPDINAKPRLDTILCTGDSIVYSPGGFDSYVWQDGSTGSTYTFRRGGTYRVEATNKCGTATKTVSVEEKNLHCCFSVCFYAKRRWQKRNF